MSESEKPVKKKGKAKKILLLGAGTLLLAGGGAGAALYAGGSGLIGGGASEPDRPMLVPKDGVSAKDVERYSSPSGDKRPDPTKFIPTYYELEENFTANMQGGSGFIQIGLGVSTYYDERVLENVKLHEMAVRSAVLLTLGEHDREMLSTPRGKEALKISLRTAINNVLKKKEGFGGIDDVHFTSFVVQ